MIGVRIETIMSIRERVEKLIFDPSEIERIRGEIFLTTRSIRGVQARKRKGEMIVLTFFFPFFNMEKKNVYIRMMHRCSILLSGKENSKVFL